MKEMEIEAIEAVRTLLRKIPALEITSTERETQIGRDKSIDGLINVRNNDDNFSILIEVKGQGQPRFVRSAIYQLRNYATHMGVSYYGPSTSHVIPMLVTTYLSPEARAICDEHNVCYLDLFGNARLVFGNVFIEISVADKPKSETRSLRSIFSPKAAAILRIMLRNPHEAWRVAELAEQADASLGHVSNVRKALLEREWVEENAEGVVLIKPRELIETWRKNYRRPLGHRVVGYTHLHGMQLEDRLRGVLSKYENRPRAIYALNSAAKWISPFGRDSMNNFYADEEGAHLLKEALQFSPSRKGANVSINIVKDESIFIDAIEPAPEVYCTSPIQTYLDLWVGNDRDQEAAEFLYEEHFRW